MSKPHSDTYDGFVERIDKLGGSGLVLRSKLGRLLNDIETCKGGALSDDEYKRLLELAAQATPLGSTERGKARVFARIAGVTDAKLATLGKVPYNYLLAVLKGSGDSAKANGSGNAGRWGHNVNQAVLNALGAMDTRPQNNETDIDATIGYVTSALKMAKDNGSEPKIDADGLLTALTEARKAKAEADAIAAATQEAEGEESDGEESDGDASENGEESDGDNGNSEHDFSNAVVGIVLQYVLKQVDADAAMESIVEAAYASGMIEGMQEETEAKTGTDG